MAQDAIKFLVACAHGRSTATVTPLGLSLAPVDVGPGLQARHRDATHCTCVVFELGVPR